jgi:hypothetical protein
MSCQWTFLPSLEDKREGVCGDPVEGDSRYCPAHHQEMQTFLASDLDYLAIKRQSKLRPGDVILNNFSGAQFEANVALDDIYIAVQDIRELVNQADAYHQTAFDSALWSLENDMGEAVSRLRKATKFIRSPLRH